MLARPQSLTVRPMKHERFAERREKFAGSPARVNARKLQGLLLQTDQNRAHRRNSLD